MNGFSMTSFLVLVVMFAQLIIVGYIVYLLIKSLRKYLYSTDIRDDKVAIRKSLGEVLREQRMKCQMTQEFVAEAIGVSRQAVSKWENGTSEPSTSNLLTIAKLYDIAPEDLIRSISTDQE